MCDALYLRHIEVRGCFEKMTRKLNRGLTLIEVMAALVIALVIAIGVMSYQYAAAQHARMTDVRVTASRLGLLFLEDWVALFGIETYDPEDRLDLGTDPLGYYLDLGAGGLPGAPSWGTPLRSYRIFTNGTYFWVELAYEPIDGNLRELGVSVAWSLDFQSESLVFDPQRLVKFSKYVVYYVPPSP